MNYSIAAFLLAFCVIISGCEKDQSSFTNDWYFNSPIGDVIKSIQNRGGSTSSDYVRLIVPIMNRQIQNKTSGPNELARMCAIFGGINDHGQDQALMKMLGHYEDSSTSLIVMVYIDAHVRNVELGEARAWVLGAMESDNAELRILSLRIFLREVSGPKDLEDVDAVTKKGISKFGVEAYRPSMVGATSGVLESGKSRHGVVIPAGLLELAGIHRS